MNLLTPHSVYIRCYIYRYSDVIGQTISFERLEVRIIKHSRHHIRRNQKHRQHWLAIVHQLDQERPDMLEPYIVKKYRGIIHSVIHKLQRIQWLRKQTHNLIKLVARINS